MRENSRAVHGEPRDIVFDGAQRPAVEHFTRGGSVRGRCVARGRRIVDGSKDGEKRFQRFGLRESFTVISVTRAKPCLRATKRP